MTTSISQPQHTPESICGPKMSVASGHSVSEDATSEKSIDLSALKESHADLYECGKQIVEQNKHLLASPPPDPSSSCFHSTSAADFEAVLADSKQLDRELNLTDDEYMAGGRSATRPDKIEFKKLPHIEVLETLIDNIHTNYQKTYADINKKTAEFMKDVNTAVGKISDFIKAGSDGKVNFRPEAFLKELDAVLSNYTDYKIKNSSDYYKWSPKDGKNEEPTTTKPLIEFKGNDDALKFWTGKLSGFTVIRKPGTIDDIMVKPNLDPIRNIYSSVANSDSRWGGSDMSSQAFQSLQSAIDSQKSAVNSTVSQLLEKFRQDNSTFETLIQLLQQMTQDLTRYNAGYFF